MVVGLLVGMVMGGGGGVGRNADVVRVGIVSLTSDNDDKKGSNLTKTLSTST